MTTDGGFDLGLGGRPAIVTGGASNIGRAITLAMAREGATVFMIDYDEVQAERTLTAAETLAGEVVFVRGDLTDRADVDRAVARIVTMTPTIEVLVNNVGWSRPAWFGDIPIDEIDKAVDVNLMATIHVTRAVLPLIVAGGGGSVVSVASDAAFGELRSSVYGAAKGGVVAFTKGLAREYGRSAVRLNVVAPGLVVPPSADDVGERSLWAGGEEDVVDERARTDILKSVPLRRLTTPEDVASVVLFFASERMSRQVTGQVVSVSGGRAMP